MFESAIIGRTNSDLTMLAAMARIRPESMSFQVPGAPGTTTSAAMRASISAVTAA